jgi:predicted RNA-binding Zn ribbon-like protein
LLPDYAALLRFMEQSGLLGGVQVRALSRRTGKDEAERASDCARELREAAASVLYAAAEDAVPPTTDLRRLALYVQNARHRQELVCTPSGPGSKFAWEWGPSDAMDRLRACGSETCRWLFLDTSKNHTRRWCDMKICGNRMKARRFQARRM